MRHYTTIIFISIYLIFTFIASAQEYVGADKCKMCHKTEKSGKQYPLWEERKHSKSFQALTLDLAKEFSPYIPAVENPQCLPCHAPLAEKSPDLKDEGVTCEVCHGPGSDYKKLSIMKNHTEAVKNGLIEYGSIEAIKTSCLSCHENAHGITFDFETAWELVKHPVPGKKQFTSK
ncbi:MAG TPA: cytochrome C554 [Bacteroidaceae bacterium]|nr:cytochrome C554 [Bacteroidaceae bacterium]